MRGCGALPVCGSSPQVGIPSAAWLLAVKGFVSVSSSNKITPSAHTSDGSAPTRGSNGSRVGAYQPAWGFEHRRSLRL